MKKLLLALLVSGYCHAEGLPACDDASIRPGLLKGKVGFTT